MKSIILIMTLISLSCFASLNKKNEKHHEHREHAAHVHGGGQLSIAFDQLNGKIEFKVAAEAVLGFEYIAIKDKDKKVVSESILKFENEISKFIQFDPALNCKFAKEKIAQVSEENEKEKSSKHSDWIANYSVSCGKSPVGTDLVIDFTSLKRIKDLDVVFIAETVQKSAEYNGKKPVTISLK